MIRITQGTQQKAAFYDAKEWEQLGEGRTEKGDADRGQMRWFQRRICHEEGHPEQDKKGETQIGREIRGD